MNTRLHNAFDWVGFRKALLAPTLSPPALEPTRSGFCALLSLLKLPKDACILDIGAGGFVGKTTTVFLLNNPHDRIDAVERNAAQAAKLTEEFGGRVHVHTADINAYEFPTMYDLIVSDLDSAMIPWQVAELSAKVAPHLKTGGFYVAGIIYDFDQTFGGENPMLKGPGENQQKFLLDFFGTLTLDCESAQAAFSDSSFVVRGIVDKWLCKGNHKGLGWLILQKL